MITSEVGTIWWGCFDHKKILFSTVELSSALAAGETVCCECRMSRTSTTLQVASETIPMAYLREIFSSGERYQATRATAGRNVTASLFDSKASTKQAMP